MSGGPPTQTAMNASLRSQTIDAVLNKPAHFASHISGATPITLRSMTMKNALLCMTAAVSLVAMTSVAQARSAYDGSWDLLFVTQRGACDPTYSFSVNITDGIVTHPNLVRFRGYVARSGAVRASVTVQDKYASGSGRLSSNSGRGTWTGHSGNARCSGYWTAQRN